VIEKYCAKQRSRTYGEGSIRSVGGYMIETRRSQEITYISAQREEEKKYTSKSRPILRSFNLL
jgi:hypothetical protein